MRLHRPWKVPIHIPRVFTGVSADRRRSISLAALLVNVTASIDSGLAWPGRQQPGDPRREHARLAAAGAGEDQRRPVRQRDRGELFRIEVGEKRGRHVWVKRRVRII